MKIALIVVAVLLGLIVAIELVLQWVVGFGNPPLYIGDEKIGYLLAPNQRVRRFGNRIEINEHSMRSRSLTPEPGENVVRVLLLGDSVANGGWWTDQQDTISALMEQQLEGAIAPEVEVLNASANSWGPRNELAYIQKFGIFGAKVVVLLINTDDLFGMMPSSVGVGRDRNYPDKKPPFALAEVFTRYVLPAPQVPKLPEEKGDRVGVNLEAIRQIQQIAIANQSQLLLAMTPLLREIGEPGPRDYEIKARDRLREFTEGENIVYIDFLPLFNAVEEPASLYRDHIHLSPTGNRLVSEEIAKSLSSASLF